MKKLISLLLCSLLLLPVSVSGITIETKAAAVILMEKESGQLLYSENEHERREPASVTKVMTLLLIMEALDEGRIQKEDTVITSTRASSMGGSQVFLKEGEQMSVHDMLKAIAVASGNDSSVAMAEHLYGSEEAFVARMNERASELGMEDTHFANCTGLPAENHYTSAHDIALMSRELILKHPDIREYTTIWMDTLRGGAFQLANTNKLIYYYEGATGLKTGSTDSALYCLSATAERDGMELIAVVLGAPTSTDRFETAKALLSFGFGAYTLYAPAPNEAIAPVPDTLGKVRSLQPVLDSSSPLLLDKSKVGSLRTSISLTDGVTAPVELGQKLGELVVYDDDTPIAHIPLISDCEVERLGVSDIFKKLCRMLFAQEQT